LELSNVLRLRQPRSAVFKPIWATRPQDAPSNTFSWVILLLAGMPETPELVKRLGAFLKLPGLA
jgi:hypothetical protein